MKPAAATAPDGPPRLGIPDRGAHAAGDVVVVDGDDREEIARALAARLGVAARVCADGVHVQGAPGHLLVPRIAETFPPGRLRWIVLRRPTPADTATEVTPRDPRP